jgi:hypothetical protein
MNRVAIKKRKAQAKYAADNNHPLFAPLGGTCWSCTGQIYDKIDLETASNTLITGCPYCKKSFVD